jgi:hypothetical protein
MHPTGEVDLAPDMLPGFLCRHAFHSPASRCC